MEATNSKQPEAGHREKRPKKSQHMLHADLRPVVDMAAATGLED